MKTSKQKFITRHRNSWTGIHEVFEVEGEICFQLFGLTFFIHGYANEWHISEVETGFFAFQSNQYQKKGAIKDARVYLESLGSETIHSGISKAKKYIEKFKDEFETVKL